MADVKISELEETTDIYDDDICLFLRDNLCNKIG